METIEVGCSLPFRFTSCLLSAQCDRLSAPILPSLVDRILYPDKQPSALSRRRLLDEIKAKTDQAVDIVILRDNNVDSSIL